MTHVSLIPSLYYRTKALCLVKATGWFHEIYSSNPCCRVATQHSVSGVTQRENAATVGEFSILGRGTRCPCGKKIERKIIPPAAGWRKRPRISPFILPQTPPGDDGRLWQIGSTKLNKGYLSVLFNAFVSKSVLFVAWACRKTNRSCVTSAYGIAGVIENLWLFKITDTALKMTTRDWQVGFR